MPPVMAIRFSLVRPTPRTTRLAGTGADRALTMPGWDV
jgi:hypothetical protein